MVLYQVQDQYSAWGGYHAHSENLLLSMLGSEDQDERKYAVEKIREIRGGDTGIVT